MQFHAFKLKFRRRLRKQQRQAAVVTKHTERNIERYFFGRFGKLGKVWRFITAWLLLMTLLIGSVVAQNVALSGYYQTLQPIPGGIYSEGVVGSFTNASPLYATNDVDQSVAHLIFAGLFKYNDQNALVGDLAKSWQVDKTGRIYTVTLRPNLTWQDGKPLTAADVVYTYHAIQSPDAQSPLRSSWTGIAVAAVDAHTVTFTLPNPLSSFVYNLTNGIVPKHLLAALPMSELRSSSFNTSTPIGAGPFGWRDIQISGDNPTDAQEEINLAPFAGYWAGAAKLRSFTLHSFARAEDMLEAYRHNQLTAIAGPDSLPSDIVKEAGIHTNSFTLTAANMVFFRVSSGLLANKAIRQALVAAADPAEVIHQLNYPAPPIREPVLADQFAYNSKYAQVTAQPSRAEQLLDKAGWKQAASGSVRLKKGKPLAFSLYAADSPENRLVTRQLQQQWQRIGVKAGPVLQDADTFHDTLTSHNYDAVLYGISIGVDPDVFAYWDSSQADIRSANRLNLSEYKSSTVNAALEGGRTRAGEALRRIKYQPFLKAWQADAPALGLYQPRYLYVSREQVYGLNVHDLNVTTDHYNNVSNWMIRTARVTNP